MTIWGGLVAAFGTIGMVVAGLFAARATKAAAKATAEATQAAAQAQAEPNQRAADLAAFQAIRDDMQKELTEVRAELRSVKALLFSVSRWALRLRDQVVALGGTPVETPEDVENYYRTGV